jgi:hypothetical protein
MNAPERGALMLVRFVSVAIIGLGVLSEGLYVVDCLAHQRPIDKLHCALNAWPLLAGLILLISSKPVAEWLSNKLDE